MPTPPASLPPAQQKEYILLKQKIALHEKNVQERKMRTLSNDTSRRSSPLPVSCTETIPLAVNMKHRAVGSKLTSPQMVKKSAESNGNSYYSDTQKKMDKESSRVEGYQIELDNCTKKLVQHKRLEEEEQHTITELTYQLTECVSDIEHHECSVDAIEKQITSLRKQQKVSLCSKLCCGCSW